MQKGLIRLNTIKIYLKCIFAVAFFSLKSFFSTLKSISRMNTYFFKEMKLSNSFDTRLQKTIFANKYTSIFWFRSKFLSKI